MAVKYLKSTTGSDSNGGTSWTDAYATLAHAFSIVAAGDTIYVSQAHAETQASVMTLTSPGTAAAPVQVLCVNDGATPPTALSSARTASVTVTGNYAMAFGAGYAYIWGITFNSSSGATSYGMTMTANSGDWGWEFDGCALVLGSTAGSAKFTFGGTGTVRSYWVRLNNTPMGFGHVSQVITLSTVKFRWRNTTSAITGSVPTSLFLPMSAASGADIECSGLDLSALGTGKSLVTASNADGTVANFRNCLLGVSVSAITGAILGPGGTQVYLDNCDSLTTNYRMEHYKFQGSIKTETTKVRSSGASDGTTTISHNFSTLGPSLFSPLEGPWISIWGDTTGASKTATIEFLHDNLTSLTNADIWLQVEYLGTSGNPESIYTNNRVTDVFATPSNQTSSSASWTTTGMTNPNTQKLAVSFTPQNKGPIRARVCVAKPSYTVYVDPLLTVV